MINIKSILIPHKPRSKKLQGTGTSSYSYSGSGGSSYSSSTSGSTSNYADKTIVQTISEAWTFLKGIFFNSGISVTGGTKTDYLIATSGITGESLTVSNEAVEYKTQIVNVADPSEAPIYVNETKNNGDIYSLIKFSAPDSPGVADIEDSESTINLSITPHNNWLPINGLCTCTSDNTIIGTNTLFLTQLAIGNNILLNNVEYVVEYVESDDVFYTNIAPVIKFTNAVCCLYTWISQEADITMQRYTNNGNIDTNEFSFNVFARHGKAGKVNPIFPDVNYNFKSNGFLSTPLSINSDVVNVNGKLNVNGNITGNTINLNTLNFGTGNTLSSANKCLNISNDVSIAKKLTVGNDITVNDKLKFLNGAELYDYSNKVNINKGINVTGNANISLRTNTADLYVGNQADIYNIVLGYMMSSEAFISGFSGEGFRLWLSANGWNMEVDSLTVRKAFYVFELILQKIRSVNGGLVVSQANGTIKSVSGDSTNYYITFDDNQFIINDLIRCQTYQNNNSLKYYYVTVQGVTGNTISTLKSEFAGIIPESGDEIVQMGNTTNTGRQSLIYISAIEGGKPRISVLDGVTGKTFTNNTRVVLGGLSGISDTDMGTLTGNGLFSDNVYLKGNFFLKSTGENIETVLTATATGLTSKVSQTDFDAYKTDSRNYIRNSAFRSALTGVTTNNTDVSISSTLKRVDKCNTLKIIQNVTPTTGLTSGYINIASIGNKVLNPASFSCYVYSQESSTLYIKIVNKPVNTFNIEASTWTLIKIENLTNNSSGTIRMGFVTQSSNGAYISEPCLTESSKAQSWQPAPEDYLLGAEIADSYSTITQTNNLIATKVSQSEYDTFKSGLTTTYSTITQTNNLIATKVSQSEYDTFKSGVTTNYSTITQTNNAITAAINNGNNIVSSINLNTTGTTISGAKINLTGASSISGKTTVDVNGKLHALEAEISGTITAGDSQGTLVLDPTKKGLLLNDSNNNQIARLGFWEVTGGYDYRSARLRLNDFSGSTENDMSAFIDIKPSGIVMYDYNVLNNKGTSMLYVGLPDSDGGTEIQNCTIFKPNLPIYPTVPLPQIPYGALFIDANANYVVKLRHNPQST